MKKIFKKIEYKNSKFKEEYKILLLNKINFSGVNSRTILHEIEKASQFKKFSFILLLGDIFCDGFENTKNKELLKQTLNKLKSTYGTFAILSKNDYKSKKSIKNLKQFFEEANVQLLRDKTVKISEDIYIGGRKEHNRLEIKDLTASLEDSSINVIFDSGDLYANRSLDEDCNLLVCGENTNAINHSEKDTNEIYKINKLNNKGFFCKKLIFTELILRRENN